MKWSGLFACAGKMLKEKTSVRLGTAPAASFLMLAAMTLTSCLNQREDDARSAIHVDGSNWATGGGNYDEQQYSQLDQITETNVSGMKLDWSLDLDDEHSLEATPIEVDGTLFFSGQMSAVYAVDARSGKLMWRYDPKTYEHRPLHQRYIFPVNRGVAYWNGAIFVGTLDGRLVAIDAKTGQERWSVTTFDPKSKMTITGAPRVFKGKVLIGSGGGDYGERGFISAYDARTGKRLWRFYTVPGDPAKGFESKAMAMAAQTWRGAWWKTGTGGTVWNAFTYDPEQNRIYVGTGNSGPYDPELRSPGGGDNLFLASIVALNADTGQYIWHYQVNPREAWDFKATANIVLATLNIQGKRRRVLMQSPTNGFFYVIDRDKGKLISAEKTGKVTWADRIDLKTGRPVEAPNIRYQQGPITFWPSPLGTHNWQPMSFSPQTGLVYIPYMQLGARFEKVKPGQGLSGSSVNVSLIKSDHDDGTGALLAWDPVAQKARWKIRRNEMWNGGILSTAGNLVFQGDAEGNFEARNATSGVLLWRFNAGLGIVGAPITYKVAGRQYVSVLVGFGGTTAPMNFMKTGWKYGLQPRRILTFSLDGQAKLPVTPPPEFTLAPLDDPALSIDPAAARAGAALYGNKSCIMCHGIDLRSPGAPAPDLRESGVAMDEAAFGQFLTGGARSSVGMPAFPELKPQEIRSLFMYIRASARAAKLGKQYKSDVGGDHF